MPASQSFQFLSIDETILLADDSSPDRETFIDSLALLDEFLSPYCSNPRRPVIAKLFAPVDATWLCSLPEQFSRRARDIADKVRENTKTGLQLADKAKSIGPRPPGDPIYDLVDDFLTKLLLQYLVLPR